MLDRRGFPFQSEECHGQQAEQCAHATACPAHRRPMNTMPMPRARLTERLAETAGSITASPSPAQRPTRCCPSMPPGGPHPAAAPVSTVQAPPLFTVERQRRLPRSSRSMSSRPRKTTRVRKSIREDLHHEVQRSSTSADGLIENTEVTLIQATSRAMSTPAERGKPCAGAVRKAR